MTFSDFRLDGRVAVVTGGTGGIGSVSACALAHAGADVVIAAPDIDDHPGVVEAARKAGRRVRGLYLDVTKADSVDKMVRAVLSEFGRIDILFNNAGVIASKTFLELDEGDWHRVMDVSALGTFLCSQAVARHMVERRSGKIINMGSILAEHGIANRSAYCAAKAAVANLTRAMAVELGPYGINVNTLAPTAIITDLNRELVDRQPQVYDVVLNRMPIRRLGRPEDLAGALVFLASSASDFITGQLIHVDGGFSAT